MPSGEYDPETVERRWQERWVEEDLYAYEGAVDPDTVFPIDSPPPVESVVTGVDLDYSLVGPEFGSRVSDIEAAIADGDHEVVDGRLHAADATLDAEMFEIEEERQYTGDGEMVEAGDTVVIVRD